MSSPLPIDPLPTQSPPIETLLSQAPLTQAEVIQIPPIDPPPIDDPDDDLTIFERYHRELWGNDSPSIARINRALEAYEIYLQNNVPTESQARLISEIQDLLKMVVPKLEVGGGLLPPETLVNFLQEWDAVISEP